MLPAFRSIYWSLAFIFCISPSATAASSSTESLFTVLLLPSCEERLIDELADDVAKRDVHFLNER
jgi:hypothetical protein